jgi:peptide deformylase
VGSKTAPVENLLFPFVSLIIFSHMTVNDIKIYPDPFLRIKSETVTGVDKETGELIKDMFEIMNVADGIGLAAPQIGISKRIIVISINEKKFDKLALINPVIESYSTQTSILEEGCLSVPGVNAEVERPQKIVVKSLTRSGRLVEISADNLLARVLQHEIDHLDGILFIDRLNSQERKRVEVDIEALQKRYGTLIH